MFGIKYIKFDSSKFVIHYSGGKIKREGRGLAFFYFAPSSSIVAIPMGSNDFQFIFNETTKDFQTVSIQGQITYKITNPKQLSEMLDFTVDAYGFSKTSDAEKLSQRLINDAQTAASSFIASLTLREALKSAKIIEGKITEGLKSSRAVELLGVELLSSNILAVKPSPEMARALEAETREALQQEADQAVYLRRNFAVEQERKIKESELSTEIAVEEKKKQIAEKKTETDIQKEQSNRKLREMKMDADISVEEQKKKLLDLKVDNEKKEADSKGYVLQATLKPYKDMDWRTLMAIGKDSSDPKMQMAVAFRELAENAQKIQTLNITPDLLQTIVSND
jgi:regulator of protease activity HflC (stomatin/prohibitin superfamily)